MTALKPSSFNALSENIAKNKSRKCGINVSNSRQHHNICLEKIEVKKKNPDLLGYEQRI
jgi:hypothetical protein